MVPHVEIAPPGLQDEAAPLGTQPGSLQDLQIGNNVLAIRRTRETDRHLCTRNVTWGIREILIERMFIPSDIRSLQRSRVAKTSFRTALSAKESGQRGADFVFARYR
jgi:hypothetical protein